MGLLRPGKPLMAVRPSRPSRLRRARTELFSVHVAGLRGVRANPVSVHFTDTGFFP